MKDRYREQAHSSFEMGFHVGVSLLAIALLQAIKNFSDRFQFYGY